MMKILSDNVIWVNGAKSSAIYDFNSGNVFSINHEGTKILKDYFEKPDSETSNSEFIIQVKKILNLSKLENADFVFDETNNDKVNFAWLEVTQKCPSRCIHCYEGESHVEVDNPLTLENWYSVISELGEMGCNNIQFIGGEPTIYQNLELLIEQAVKCKVKHISIFTNLYVLRKSLLECIINNDIAINFSIYGHKPEVHDKITQINGSFEKMINHLNILSDNGVKLCAHIVVMKENEEFRDNIYELLKNLNIKDIRFDEIRKVYGGCQNNHLVANTRMKLTKPNFKASWNQFNLAFNRNTCWYGKCVISTNGNIYPCEFERNVTYGNILKDNLKDIILSEKVRQCWYMDYSKIDFCKDCEFRFACNDCRPLAYAERGIITDKIPRCSYNPYTGKWNEGSS